METESDLSSVRVAISYTIRTEDEIDLVLENIRCHRLLGFSDFYVFPDQPFDFDSIERLTRHPGVRVLDYVPYETLASDHELFRRYYEESRYDHCARDTFRNLWAARDAAARGVAWYAVVDPDEVFCIDPDSIAGSDVRRLVTSAAAHATHQFTFLTYESLPLARYETSEPLNADRFVSPRLSLTDRALQRMRKLPLLGRFFRRWYRAYYDPYNERELYIEDIWHIGHRHGKSIFNLAFVDDYFPTKHLWVPREGIAPGPIHKRPGLLHFFFIDFVSFRRSMLNYVGRLKLVESGRELKGRGVRFRWRFKRINTAVANDNPESAHWEYYREHVAVDPGRLPLSLRGRVVEIRLPSLLYARLREKPAPKPARSQVS